MNKPLWLKKLITLCYLAVCLSGVAVASQTRPYIPLPPIDFESDEFDRFESWVDQAVGGRPGYEFAAYEAAMMARIAKDNPKLGIDPDDYAELAIKMVDSYVKAAEEAVAQGNRPQISHDSYLHVGPQIRSLATTYDWLYDRLSPEQRARWEKFAEQAIWNVWNHNQAKWGDKVLTWSGWSRDNPGNNYYYSFVTATMLWGLASQNKTWLDFLRKDRFPLLTNYFKKLPGGGSREGTGYGTAYMELFRLYREWRDASGEDLSAANTHCRDSINYWVHATVPTLERFAPIGDQARDSSASLFDYQEHLMLEAVNLNKNTPEAQLGAWWLNHNSVERMRHGFNFHKELIRQKLPEAAPTALVYHSIGTGHLFARSSWDKKASWISFVAGPYDESHAHQDQGAFSIYKKAWLAVTENIRSHSGIQQGVDVHNVIAFMSNGKPLRQFYTDKNHLSYTDVDGLLTIKSELIHAYHRSPDVKKWNRELGYNRAQHSIRVHDRFAVANGIEAVWQINVPEKPRIDGDQIIAGDLIIKPVSPAKPQIEIIDWRDVDATEFRGGGWKVMLRGGNKEYIVEMKVDD